MGPTISPTPESVDIEVRDIGVWNYNQAGQMRTQWVALARNASAGFVLRDSSLTFLVYGSNGGQLSSGTEAIAVLLPGQEVVVGGTLPPFAGQPARVSVEPRTGRKEVPAPGLPAWNPAPGEYVATPSSREIRGTLTSPLPVQVTNLKIACVGFDASGKLSAYGVQTVPSIPAGGSVAVACPLPYEPSAAITRASLYPLLGSPP